MAYVYGASPPVAFNWCPAPAPYGLNAAPLDIVVPVRANAEETTSENVLVVDLAGTLLSVTVR